MSNFGINGIDPRSLHSMSPTGNSSSTSGKSFVDTISDAVDQVDDMSKQADQAVQDLATGRRKTLHETMIQVEQAGIAFDLLMAVRDKVVSAYREVMNLRF